ncbi:MAG: efflux RND transporter periplasmic adaptor subunit [Phycisphaerales bacterium]|nr:efflux RND transporter periplasmic adaptor subunit [Phycisphaerales bacterium]
MKTMKYAFATITAVSVTALALLVTGCENQEPAGAPQQRIAEVAVVEVAAQPVTLTTELPGRVAAFLEADVRPQVSGIIQSRLFEEGADVNAGDVLYQIDAARYEAAFARAKASLAMAEAELPAIRSRVERYRSALTDNAVSKQDYDDASASLQQAEATIALRRAEVESAQIDLSYTQITAPISGRIGTSRVTVGSLVTADQPAPLSTINQFDPVFVDVPQSSTQLLRLRRELETGVMNVGSQSHEVHIVLEDGTEYPQPGTLQFRDVQVDPSTGTFKLRVTVPNADHVLLPGMFVRAVIQEGVVDDGILVPQQGVSRNPKGEPIAFVVNAEDKVEQRTLNLNRAIGNQWLVESGLGVGDRLIMEGLQRIRPGNPVHAVAFNDKTAEGEGASEDTVARSK